MSHIQQTDVSFGGFAHGMENNVYIMDIYTIYTCHLSLAYVILYHVAHYAYMRI